MKLISAVAEASSSFRKFPSHPCGRRPPMAISARHVAPRVDVDRRLSPIAFFSHLPSLPWLQALIFAEFCFRSPPSPAQSVFSVLLRVGPCPHHVTSLQDLRRRYLVWFSSWWRCLRREEDWLPTCSCFRELACGRVSCTHVEEEQLSVSGAESATIWSLGKVIWVDPNCTNFEGGF